MGQPLISGESWLARDLEQYSKTLSAISNDIFELAKKIAVIGAFSLAQSRTKYGSDSWIALAFALICLKTVLVMWAGSHAIAANYPRVRRFLQVVTLDRTWLRALVFVLSVAICALAFWQFNKGFERIVDGITAGLAAPAK